MKKLTVLTLCCAMLLSMAACGSDTNDADNQTEQDAADNSGQDAADNSEQSAADNSEQNAADMQAFLSNFAMIGPSEDLFYTGWEFAGGLVDGVEMNDKDASDFLSLYGGKLQLVFEDMEQISMLQGGGLLSGSYTVADDGVTMKIVFDNKGTDLTYAGLYVYNADNVPVILLLPDASGKNALYFTRIDEH